MGEERAGDGERRQESLVEELERLNPNLLRLARENLELEARIARVLEMCEREQGEKLALDTWVNAAAVREALTGEGARRRRPRRDQDG